FSGELDHRIGDAYRPVRKHVETGLNTRCEARDYGDAVKKIAIIPMILGPEVLKNRKERRLWQRQACSADYRTIIDFEQFRVGDEVKRQRLLIRNTIDAVRDLKQKAGDRFRGDELVVDILDAFNLTLSDLEDA